MNSIDQRGVAVRLNFAHVTTREQCYSHDQLAAIGRAVHQCPRAPGVSMTGAVIIAAAVLFGVALVAMMGSAVFGPAVPRGYWAVLALPVLLVALIAYVGSRAPRRDNAAPVETLLDAGLCGACAAPLRSSTSMTAHVCEHCYASWTGAIGEDQTPSAEATGSEERVASLDRLRIVKPWQTDAYGARVPVAMAFARGILAASGADPALRARRRAAFEEFAQLCRNDVVIAWVAGVALIGAILTMRFSTGMLVGVGVAGAIASALAFLPLLAARAGAVASARKAMLDARLCPCCASDLDAHGKLDWAGQPLMTCTRCASAWYLFMGGVSYAPHAGAARCRGCGYVLAGLSPDASAMVTCPECSRRCPLPGHAACAVCDTALLVKPETLRQGVVCPSCQSLNRLGVRGIEHE